MWLYPGPSDPDRSFYVELSNAEISTRILKVSDHGTNLKPGSGHAPLREGVASPRVSLFGFVLAACAISSSRHTSDLA
jgi:hypothetical protein